MLGSYHCMAYNIHYVSISNLPVTGRVLQLLKHLIHERSKVIISERNILKIVIGLKQMEFVWNY